MHTYMYMHIKVEKNQKIKNKLIDYIKIYLIINSLQKG